MSIAATFTLVIDTYFRSSPSPHISGSVFLSIFFGALLLSVLAGYLASRWWFVETGLLTLCLLLLWIGEFLFESKL